MASIKKLPPKLISPYVRICFTQSHTLKLTILRISGGTDFIVFIWSCPLFNPLFLKMAVVNVVNTMRVSQMYPRMPNVPWCVPSLYDQYTPQCSSTSAQSVPWAEPAGVGGLTGWGRFCVRPPQPAAFTDTLGTGRGNRQSQQVSSDTNEREKLASESAPSPRKTSELVIPVKMETDDPAESSATPVLDMTSSTSAAGGDRGAKTGVCYQSFSCSTTTLTFAEVKPEPCSTPSQMSGSVADGRRQSMAEVMTSQQDPASRYAAAANPPTSEGEGTAPRLMPLTNVAPQGQHKPEPVDRYCVKLTEERYRQ